jgi:putative tricarboxylic transport membrane protein
MSDTDPIAGRKVRGLLGPRIFAIVLLLFGLGIAYSATTIRQGGGFTVIGPQVFPLAVSIGLIILAVILLLRTTLLPDAAMAEQAASEASATYWPTVGAIAMLLVGYPFALTWLGYILGTTLFLPLAARTLGSRKPVRDLLVGLCMAVIIYIGFTRFLGVRLPAGPLAGLL